jgi:hypothetical protein
MTENKNNLKLDSLREEIRDPVKAFAEKLIAELGDNLESITVVGSSLTEDFSPGQSDINTVLVLSKQTLDSLNTLASMAKSMRKRKLSAPLLMTSAYIEQSCDVFGTELLDLQLTHQTIFGDDPFEKLTFNKQDVRLQCERELKATLIRLRQGYIAAATNKKLVYDILASAAGGLVPLLRAMLWLKDSDRPRQAELAFSKSAAEFLIQVDSLIEARKWRHKKARLQDEKIATTFESIYSAVEQLALIVDKLEV